MYIVFVADVIIIEIRVYASKYWNHEVTIRQKSRPQSLN